MPSVTILQWRKSHEDAHYAAPLFRYMRTKYCVMLRDYYSFICMDDKHCVKIEEPGLPVAAAERGHKVLVKKGVYFQVGDHNFIKFAIIPSVALIIATPEEDLGMMGK